MAQRNRKPKKFFSQKAQMPFSFDEDVKNLWLLLVDCGVVFGATFLLFHPCKNSFFGTKYMREKQKKALLREIIAYLLFFFFFSPLWDETLCNFTSRQVFLDNSWSRSLAFGLA